MTEKYADKAVTDGREVIQGMSSWKEWKEWIGREEKNEMVQAVTRLLSLLLFWVRDASSPEGTSSSYHSEQTAGTSFSLLASLL